ncbi:MAG: DUF427 domain-containing protein [Acidimicrobiia bacterium]
MTETSANPHHITVEDVDDVVRVEVDGTVLAESSRARVLREGAITPRYYFPPDDVNTEFLVATDNSSTCPFKGDASYWSVVLGDVHHKNLVWSYEAPISGMEPITELLCFYNERVDLYVGGELQA